ACVVKTLGAELVGEVDRVLRALDVRPAVCLLVGRHVVDGSQMKEVIDAGERLLVLVRDTQKGRRQIAHDGNDPPRRYFPRRDQLFELRPRAFTDHHIDSALMLQKPLDQMTADEPGRSGDEVPHPSLSPFSDLDYGSALTLRKKR